VDCAHAGAEMRRLQKFVNDTNRLAAHTVKATGETASNP